MEDKIDVHKRARQYQKEIAKLEADTRMSPKERKEKKNKKGLNLLISEKAVLVKT